MCASILNFFTRQSLEILTDRTTKVAKTVRGYEKLTFQSIVVGADFERQKGKDLFELEQLQRACSRTIIRTDN